MSNRGYFIMDNNTKLIATISIEKDFEKLIKLYIQKIYDANAYLIGGPWDNGKDLVIKRRGKEVKEAVQISIQEKNIEQKVEGDIIKIIDLVDNHEYPPVLNFFWSHPISEYTLDKIRTNAKNKHAITLEFYDAKRISQDISDNYPDLLNYLMRDIHNFNVEFDEKINIQQRAFYEYLLLSKDSANLKNAIIDANIMSMLSEKGKNLDEISLAIQNFRIRPNSLKERLNKLIKTGKISLFDDIYKLTDNESIKINNIRVKQSARKGEILSIIRDELKKYTDKDLANEVIKLITTAYEESLNVQLSESKFEPPKTLIFNSTFRDLKRLIHEECSLDDTETDRVVKKLMEISGQNDYLSEHCSAKLCINLLADSKLEKYIENKKFYIYLDAPVLIPYILTSVFNDRSLFDKSISNIDLMRSHIRNLKNKRLRISNEHFEETVRHLEQAKKLSYFVTRELVEELGESKNVYFNVFMRWKNTQPASATFDDFIYKFIGLEPEDVGTRNIFNTYSSYIYDLLTSANFDIINHADSVDDRYITKVRAKYNRETRTARSPRAIDNDIICASILSEDKFHLDEAGYLSTPMLITLDTLQYTLRQIIRRENRGAEWLVYTPQRAIERLSLIGLKISPECLKDGVLAAISEEYFFNENKSSLIDTLSILVGDETASSGDVIKFVTRLKRNVTEESADNNEIDIERYNNISYVLLYIHNEFRNEFSKIIELFNNASLRDSLTEILLNAISGDFKDPEKEILNRNINKLIRELE